MKRITAILLGLLPLLAESQYINTRLYNGVDSFYNSFWNNWPTKVKVNDTSDYLKDVAGNKTKIRAVLTVAASQFDNGAGYMAGDTVSPDTVIRKGVYYSQTFGINLVGLDTAYTYQLGFYSSRLKTDQQYTSFSIGKDSVTVLSNSNISESWLSGKYSPSSAGVLSIYISRKVTFGYINGFTIIGTPKTPPVTAVIVADSTVINYPNSAVRLKDSSTGPVQNVQWMQVAGPSDAIFTPDSGNMIWLSRLQPGLYAFQLTVTDVNLFSSTATSWITVNGPPAVKPRSVTGASWVFTNGVWVYKFYFDDGTVQ